MQAAGCLPAAYWVAQTKSCAHCLLVSRHFAHTSGQGCAQAVRSAQYLPAPSGICAVDQPTAVSADT